MQNSPHLIGSYNSEKNIYILYDRKIASSLITMFYHRPIKVQKNKLEDSNYNIILDKKSIDSKKIQTHILIRNPISRIKSYISERTFKQLHHFIYNDIEYKDGYDENIFKNNNVIDIFDKIKEWVYLKNNKYYLNIEKTNTEYLYKFIEYIMSSLMEFVEGKNTPTLNNKYHEKIYEFIKDNNTVIIDVTNLSTHFESLGIDISSEKFKTAELHRNGLWSQMIKELYPYIKNHEKYNIIKEFIENEVYFYRKILKEYKLSPPNNITTKNII